MTTHPYHEDPIVEQPAIQLIAALGWQTVAARMAISEPSIQERTSHA